MLITAEKETCPVCNEPAQPPSKYCQTHFANRHGARTVRRASLPTFTGVDGEGINVTINGVKIHRYVMLSVGDETLFRNGEELDHRIVFPFLYQEFVANPHNTFIGYYLSYDFTMWLKSLPESAARLLWNKDSRPRRKSNQKPLMVYVDGWDIDILGMKRFQLRPHHCVGRRTCILCEGRMPRERIDPEPIMSICDTGPFWQTSFLKAIDPATWPKPVVTPAEYETIREGKANRGNEESDLSYVADMMKYNRLENDVLCRVTRELASGYASIGIRLRKDSWYGPGPAVQAWLNELDKQGAFLSREKITHYIDKDIRDAYRKSYFGGRFELFIHGHIPGTTHEYDIQSAYPDAIRRLPCLCNPVGWKRESGSNLRHPIEPYSLVHGTFTGSDIVAGGLPHRSLKGHITFPNVTSGWYLWTEVQAAMRAKLIDSCELDTIITYTPCDHAPPMAAMAELFDLRLSVGKNTPQGKALKLVLNSAYGKTAQSIGAALFGNPIYASMITSACRARILDAIAEHPTGTNSLVMIATDGVYFREPVETLDLTPNKLGAWEHQKKVNMTTMKPGVYWDDSTRESLAHGQVKSVKSRGINASVMAGMIPDLDEQFRTMTADTFPVIKSTMPFNVLSPIAALARNRWEQAGQVTWDDLRKDSADPAPKRINLRRVGDVWRSDPAIPELTESVPYSRFFGDEAP